MSRTYDTHCVSVICPFFVGKERSRIVCEGIAPKSSISMAFASPADCAGWRKVHCDSDYQRCPFAELLNDKWDKILEHRQ